MAGGIDLRPDSGGAAGAICLMGMGPGVASMSQ